MEVLLQSGCGSSLAAQSSCQLTVTYTSELSGTDHLTVTVQNGTAGVNVTTQVVVTVGPNEPVTPTIADLGSVSIAGGGAARRP